MILHCATCGTPLEYKRRPGRGEPRCKACINANHNAQRQVERDGEDCTRWVWQMTAAPEFWQPSVGRLFPDRRIDLLQSADIFGGCRFRNVRTNEEVEV